MKYAVIGIGAVGSIIGAVLSKSNKNVILIGKKNQIDILNKNGLTIKGLNIKQQSIKATSEIAMLNNVDIIFICIKSQDTQKLANKIKKYLKKSAIIISLQNGIENAETIEKITNIKTISGIVLFNSFYYKTGECKITLKKGLILENHSISKNISDILNKNGLKSIIIDDIKPYLYSKLIVNLQNAVSSLTNQTTRRSIYNKYSREIIVETMKEGLNILKKSNIKIKRLSDIDPVVMIKRLEKYNSIFLLIGSCFTGLKKNARNSMWQSLNRKKTTEIDYINGVIVNIAKNNNLNAPINKKLIELIKKKEKASKQYNPIKLKKILM